MSSATILYYTCSDSQSQNRSQVKFYSIETIYKQLTTFTLTSAQLMNKRREGKCGASKIALILHNQSSQDSHIDEDEVKHESGLG